MLQQYLPFTVLKRDVGDYLDNVLECVATVLTVYGIETKSIGTSNISSLPCVATVLTVYGIETLLLRNHRIRILLLIVATVLTVCGIETVLYRSIGTSLQRLQQCLPLAVLKLKCL